MNKTCVFLAFFLTACIAFCKTICTIVPQKAVIGADNTAEFSAILSIPEGIHIYSQTKQQLGLPTKIELSLPSGFELKSEEWPEAKNFDFMDFKSLGYSGKIEVKFKIAWNGTKPEALPLAAKAKFSWLECGQLCEPGNAVVDFEILTKNTKTKSSGSINSELNTPESGLLKVKTSGTIWFLLGAFLGGMILNLMPCVFPVIGIKIFSLAKASDGSRSKAVLATAAYAGGILATFWLLAGLLVWLRALGSDAGWGFQLQNPVFVAMMGLLFFAMAMSFAGVFEVGMSLVSLRADRVKNKYLEATLSGVLAVLVASPCTAPFMGTAVGAALASDASAWLTFSIFTALGLGLGFPYVILSAMPSLTKFLPKSGEWLQTFKEILSIPLFATVIWLVVVFKDQGGSVGCLLSAILVLGIGLAAYGKWTMPHLSAKIRATAWIVCAACITTAITTAIVAAPESSDNGSSKTATSETLSTKTEEYAWSAERQKSLTDKGKIVYVDFTASWCLTCQYNKIVLDSAAVKAAFEKYGVVKLVGDWTNRDSAISAQLAKFGRAGVPLNYVVSKNGTQILPALLTESSVIEAIDKATR